jgi:hypothetical protein
MNHAYRDKKVVGVFVRFRAPLQSAAVIFPIPLLYPVSVLK